MLGTALFVQGCCSPLLVVIQRRISLLATLLFFFVAAMVSTTLPKSNESGANAEIGRVHGWINAPVNAWLKEDRREPGDGNRERFWKTGRVNAK